MAKYVAFGDFYNTKPSNKTPNAENPYATVVYPDVIVPGESERIIWYHHNVKVGLAPNDEAARPGQFIGLNERSDPRPNIRRRGKGPRLYLCKR